MTLEGSLEAFSLPDIFQLLSFTKKSGALHIKRGSSAGVVHFTTGSVTGATSDTARQALARRLVGAGVISDDALAAAVAAVQQGGGGLGRALHDAGAVDEAVLHEHVVEQATDSVFDLLRWQQGDFAFVGDEVNPDDIGVSLPVDDLTTEARRRLEQWESLTKKVPSPDSVVGVALQPATTEVTLTAEEWAVLALADGRRNVADMVRLSGRGEYATVRTLASLVERGVISVCRPDEAGDDGVAALLRRQAELSRLEGRPEPVAPAEPDAAPPAPMPVEPEAVADDGDDAATDDVAPVVPARPEPIRPRAPEYPEKAPRRAAPAARTAGSSALAEAPGALIERDPSVNKSLLLRLIAGVRGL